MVQFRASPHSALCEQFGQRNNCTFNGTTHLILSINPYKFVRVVELAMSLLYLYPRLKDLFFSTLLEWSLFWPSCSWLSLPILVNQCNLGSSFFATVHFHCT